MCLTLFILPKKDSKECSAQFAFGHHEILNQKENVTRDCPKLFGWGGGGGKSSNGIDTFPSIQCSNLYFIV